MITTKERLDYETRSSYTLNVTASDNGIPNKLSSYSLINVTVLDSNDNRPMFDKRIYQFNVTENTPKSIIGTLKASLYAA